MDTKPFWASKTFWVNIVAVAVSIGAAFGLDLGLSAEEQATVVGTIMGIVNIVLRFTSNTPIALKKE